jgi:Protein of unknown function (DUF3106)
MKITTEKAQNIQYLQWVRLATLFIFAAAFFALQSNANAAEHLYDAEIVLNADETGFIQVDGENNLNPQPWAALSGDEQKVLTPLAKEWDTLRPWQREKMRDIAKDYPNMEPKQQERVQKRLNAWSRMTPYERENARKRYQQFNSLSPERKAELRQKWAEHQKLPEAEREKRRQESPDTYDDAAIE